MLRIETMSLEEGKDELRRLLMDLTRQLDFAIHAITSGEGVGNPEKIATQKEIIKTVFLMVQAVGISIHSLVKLTAKIDMGIRDCFGIARSISEGALNAAYIIAGGEEVAAKARRHAFQKSYRDLSRKSRLDDIAVLHSEIPTAASVPGLEDAIAEFTRKNGTEITEWSGFNINEKIDIIINKYPSVQLSLSVSTFAIYRHASEILHGSFYGVEFFWTGGGSGPPTKSSFSFNYVYNHLVGIFTAVHAAVNALLEVLYIEYDIAELRKEHRNWLNRAAHLFAETPPRS